MYMLGSKVRIIGGADEYHNFEEGFVGIAKAVVEGIDEPGYFVEVDIEDVPSTSIIRIPDGLIDEEAGRVIQAIKEKDLEVIAETEDDDIHMRNNEFLVGKKMKVVSTWNPVLPGIPFHAYAEGEIVKVTECVEEWDDVEIGNVTIVRTQNDAGTVQMLVLEKHLGAL